MPHEGGDVNHILLAKRYLLPAILAISHQLSAISLAQALSLSDALAALPQSPDWQSHDLRFQSSQRSLEAAHAAAGLQLRGSGSYNYLAQDTNSSSTNSLGLSASLNLLPWSGANDQIRSAERNLESTALDLRDSRTTLALNLVHQYFAVRNAVSDLELAQVGERLAAERLRIATVQQAAAQITRENLLQSQQSSENARITRLQAEGNLENARLSLYNALGKTPEAVGLSTAPQALPMPQGNLDALIALALQHRGDVKKARLGVEGAEDNLAVAQRDRWLPPASVNVGYGPRSQGGSAVGLSYSASLDLHSGNASLGVMQNGVNSSQPSGTSINTFTLGLSISLPILAPASDARINSANTALDLARKALESAHKSAELDVRGRYLEASTATARLKVQQLGLDNATQALATAQARRQAGLNTALDVQQAEVNVRQAQRDLEATTATQMLAVYRLLGAIGAFEQLPIHLGGK
jgi:outer membrane protein TolC